MDGEFPWPGPRTSGRRNLAIGAEAPIDDFGLVHVETPVVDGRQAWSVAHGTVDIDQTVAAPADEMVVIVTYSVLVPGGRACGLNPTDDVVVGQDGQRIIDRLPGNRPDLSTNPLGHFIRTDVRMGRHGTKHGEALGCDLDTMAPKHCCVVWRGFGGHGSDRRANSGLCQELGVAEIGARNRRSATFAADAVVVGVQTVDVLTNHLNRSADIGRPVPTAAGAVDVAGDRNAAGIVRVASAAGGRGRRLDRGRWR